MKVLRVEPYKPPYEKEIDSSLESLQHEVGGWIQAVFPFEDADVAVICHEEGKLNGMELNRALRDENGEVYDVIAGPFLIVGLGEEDFTSLSDDLTDKYKEVFAQPEVFLQTNSGLLVMPYVMDGFQSPGTGDRER